MGMPPALRSAVWPWRVATSPPRLSSALRSNNMIDGDDLPRATGPLPPAHQRGCQRSPAHYRGPCRHHLQHALLCSALLCPCHAVPAGWHARHADWRAGSPATAAWRVGLHWNRRTPATVVIVWRTTISQAREAHGLGHVVVHRCAWLLARDMLPCACLVHLAFCSFLARLV